MTTLPSREPFPKPHEASESPVAKFFISGGVTLFFEAFGGGHYFEMVKILKQTSNDTYATITKRMIANKGIVGILDGFVPWGAMQSLIKGSSFGFGQAAANKFLLYVSSSPSNPIHISDNVRAITSGGMGGFVQGVVMSPMLLLKTRVMTDPRFRKSGGFLSTSYHSLKLGKELINNEGAISLTKGMGVFSMKRFMDWTTRYGFVVWIESLIKTKYSKKKLNKKEEMFCSLFGGTLSALVTVPIDVMVATIQQANKAGKKVSIFEIYKEQFRSGGIIGTLQLSTRGLVARVTHVALTVLMMKNVSTWCYELLLGPVNKPKH